jgi:hypothetical protein
MWTFPNKRNTQLDFFDIFHNIKNFVQVDHFVFIIKNRSILSFDRAQKNAGGRKFFPIIKNKHILVPDYRAKISANSDQHALHNMSSNLTVKISGTDNNRRSSI